MPVFFSYACKADSKSAGKRPLADPDWSAISQEMRKNSVRELVFCEEMIAR
jgi:hypothetical protein